MCSHIRGRHERRREGSSLSLCLRTLHEEREKSLLSSSILSSALSSGLPPQLTIKQPEDEAHRLGVSSLPAALSRPGEAWIVHLSALTSVLTPKWGLKRAPQQKSPNNDGSCVCSCFQLPPLPASSFSSSSFSCLFPFPRKEKGKQSGRGGPLLLKAR